MKYVDVLLLISVNDLRCNPPSFIEVRIPPWTYFEAFDG